MPALAATDKVLYVSLAPIAESNRDPAIVLLEQDLHEFVKEAWAQIDPAPYEDGQHIRLICRYLEKFAHGDIPALLINIPPRHCKSLIVSVCFQAWLWTTQPETAALFTSYAESLAHDHARLFKQLISSTWYQERWPHVEIAYGHDKVSHYENTRLGKRYSVAISSTMGKGGRFIGFDDPHNVLEAESDEVRDRDVRNFNLILASRTSHKRGGFIVIMQRLHERDYSGNLIDIRPDLVHLCLPAHFESDHPFRTLGYRRVADRKWQKSEELITFEEHERDPDNTLPGDWRTEDQQLLWPEMFDEDRLYLMVLHMAGYGEAGQLQQRPVPRAGGMLKAEWLKYVPKDHLKGMKRIRVRAWDLAASDRKDSPWTVGALMSAVFVGTIDREPVFDIYIEHVTRFRCEEAEVLMRVKAQAQIDGRGTYIDIPQDPGQSGKAQVKQYQRNLPSFPLHWSPESGSKPGRFQPVASNARAGHIYIVEGEWNQEYVDEITVFPGSKYQDQADATSRGHMRLLELGGTLTSGVSSGSY